MAGVESLRWKDRASIRLSNHLVELIVHSSEGHLAQLSFIDGSSTSAPTLLWEAPWAAVDEFTELSESALAQYGGESLRVFLASYSGHALCIDYFGPRSTDRLSSGLSLRGEAALQRWNAWECNELQSVSCCWNAIPPLAQLVFERQTTLREGETVFRVRETVRSHRKDSDIFDWAQHVTFGPPFLEKEKSVLLVSGDSALTSPFGYEGRSLLAENREVTRLITPLELGEDEVDLRFPFTNTGRGFIAGVRLTTNRRFEHLLAINGQMRLVVGFRNV